jgi:hypothetical protein
VLEANTPALFDKGTLSVLEASTPTLFDKGTLSVLGYITPPVFDIDTFAILVREDALAAMLERNVPEELKEETPVAAVVSEGAGPGEALPDRVGDSMMAKDAVTLE